MFGHFPSLSFLSGHVGAGLSLEEARICVTSYDHNRPDLTRSGACRLDVL